MTDNQITIVAVTGIVATVATVAIVAIAAQPKEPSVVIHEIKGQAENPQVIPRMEKKGWGILEKGLSMAQTFLSSLPQK